MDDRTLSAERIAYLGQRLKLGRRPQDRDVDRLCFMARRSLEMEEALRVIRDGTGASAASLIARAALTPTPSHATETLTHD